MSSDEQVQIRSIEIVVQWNALRNKGGFLDDDAFAVFLLDIASKVDSTQRCPDCGILWDLRLVNNTTTKKSTMNKRQSILNATTVSLQNRSSSVNKCERNVKVTKNNFQDDPSPCNDSKRYPELCNQENTDRRAIELGQKFRLADNLPSIVLEAGKTDDLEEFDDFYSIPSSRQHMSTIDPKTGNICKVRGKRRPNELKTWLNSLQNDVCLESPGTASTQQKSNPRSRRIRCRSAVEQRIRAAKKHPLRAPCTKDHFNCPYFNQETELRRGINTMFWRVDLEQRRCYLLKCVKVRPIQRRRASFPETNENPREFRKTHSRVYCLPDANKVMRQVCSRMFCSVIGTKSPAILQELIRRLSKYSLENSVKDGRSGIKKEAKKDEEFIRGFISRFNGCHQVSCRSMYKQYLLEVSQVQDKALRKRRLCSEEKFRRMLKKERPVFVQSALKKMVSDKNYKGDKFSAQPQHVLQGAEFENCFKPYTWS